MTDRRLLYLHGFASDRDSTKGVRLRERLAAAGHELELLDGNVPAFERMTYSAILAYIDAVVAERPADRLVLAGSSMGGYLVARWAELNPDRVESLLLLCPGFDLAARWPLMLGERAFAAWERDGSIVTEDGRSLHWAFVPDSRRHPAYPEVRCPTRILHGTRDEVVPIDFSRRYAAERDHVTLVELDDDHLLHDSIETIGDELVDLLG